MSRMVLEAHSLQEHDFEVPINLDINSSSSEQLDAVEAARQEVASLCRLNGKAIGAIVVACHELPDAE